MNTYNIEYWEGFDMKNNQIKYKIYKFLYYNRDYAFDAKKIFFACNIENDDAAAFNKEIRALKKEPWIISNDKKIQWNNNYFLSVIYATPGPYYMFNENDKYVVQLNDDVYPVDGDHVICEIVDRISLTGKVVSVAKRNTKVINGTLTYNNGVYFVIPDKREKYKFDFYLPGENVGDILPYSKVQVLLDEFDVKKKPQCQIKKIIRSTIKDVNLNTKAILAKNDIPYRFTEDEHALAKQIKQRISYNNYTSRTISDEHIVTLLNNPQIAFSCIKNNSGFEFGLYILDVAGYVPENSHLNVAAKERMHSCYLDKKYGIFPDELSDRVCFSKGKKSLAIGFKFYFDEKGTRENFDVFESIILPTDECSAVKIDQYINERNEEFEENHINSLETIINVYDLYLSCGYKSFEQAIDMYLIDCDILSGIIFYFEKFPAIFSYYSVPSQIALTRLAVQAKSVGIECDLDKKDSLTNDDLLKVLLSAREKNLEVAIKTQLMSFFATHSYSWVPVLNILKNNITVPVTKPLDSFASLFNQRLLKRYIRKRLRNDNVEDMILCNIKNICENLEKKEKSKKAAETEFKNIQWVAEHIDNAEVFEATAYMITPSGVWVVLNDGTIGLAKCSSLHSLSDKNFEYEKDGVPHKIKVGDKVNVILDCFDVKQNRIIFSL
jgi:exoribonuclease R